MDLTAMKYYDIHMIIDDDCKEGYSIFVTAHSLDEAMKIVIEQSLYEDISDLDRIDYVGEITEKEYLSSIVDL